MTKKDLRATWIAKRHALDPILKKEWDTQIENRVLTLLDGYQRIGIYLSFGDEITTRRIIHHLQAKGKRIAIPSVSGSAMHFRWFASIEQCEMNAFGILESKGERAHRDDLEVMVVPMLAYTDKGYRLGYGGGYYDRYLAQFTGVSIGLAYDSFQIDARVIDTFDIPCNIIVTHREVKNF